MSNDVYNQALSELEKYSEEVNNDIYIPSLSKTISFKPLTVRQQTEIISGTLLATDVSNTSAYAYQDVIDRIIVSNCNEEDISNISSLDRVCILIQIRSLTLGDTVEIQGETYSITDHIKAFPLHEFDFNEINNKFEQDGISCECRVPTFTEDAETNREAMKLFKVTNTQDTIGDVFMTELTKYIKSITFNDNVIDFTGLSFDQKIQVCEMLPMSLSQHVIDYIESVRALEAPFVNISVEDGETVEIPIDSQLFNK